LIPRKGRWRSSTNLALQKKGTISTRRKKPIRAYPQRKGKYSMDPSLSLRVDVDCKIEGKKTYFSIINLNNKKKKRGEGEIGSPFKGNTFDHQKKGPERKRGPELLTRWFGSAFRGVVFAEKGSYGKKSTGLEKQMG